jgi:hypothetical protein
MPEQVDECVESVLADNPDYTKSRAYAICWAQQNKATLVTDSDHLIQQADIPEKYIDGTDLTRSDFVPDADVAEAAQAAIDFVDDNGLPNPDNQREGITRAHQLVDHHEYDEPLAPRFWEEMKNFHNRHRAQDNHECDESEYDADDIEGDHDPCLADPGYFSDHTWGSDAGLEQADRITSVIDSVDGKLMTKQEDPCWEGYVMVGTKVDENGNRVPNCVPETEATQSLVTDGALEPDPPALSKALATGEFGVVDPLQKDATADLSDDIEQEALEADDFILYGKASIEQYDIENQRITTGALSAALDRFFESEDAPGIISRGHADVPVGTPVREHELADETTLIIDDERYQFEAGDTLRSEVKDADDDGLPELWLVSRLANDSEIARETRLRTLAGDLNGYSVTVTPRDTEQTPAGEDVTAVDLHAVTIGTDEQIKNKGSEFDVAEFKLGGYLSHLSQAVSETFDSLTMDEDEKGLLAKLLQRSGEELEQEAQPDGQPDMADGGDESLASPIHEAVANDTIDPDEATKLQSEVQKLDASQAEPILEAVSDDEMPVDTALETLQAMDYNGETEDDDEDEDDEGEMKADTDDAAQKMDKEEMAMALAEQFGLDEEEVMEVVSSLAMEGGQDDPGELKSAAVSELIDEAVAAKLDEALPDDLATTDDIESKLEDIVSGLDDAVLTKSDAEDLGLIDVAEDEDGNEVLRKATTTVRSPTPTNGQPDSKTLGDVVGLNGGGN